MFCTAIIWSWLFLIDVARLSSSTFAGYAVISLAYLVLVGLTAGCVALAYKWFSPILNKPSWLTIAKILIIWATLELLIAWAVSVVWIGRNGNWDNVLPFYSLTPIVILTPLRFLVRLFGFFGTSAVIGTGLVIVYKKSFRKYALPYWGVIVVINLGLWAMYKTPSGPSTSVTIVAEQLGKPHKIDLTNEDFVLLPEYGLDDVTSQNLSERFAKRDAEVYFSGTKQVTDDKGTQNVLVYGSNQRGFLHERAKSRLIVGGEYLPAALEGVLRTIRSPIYDDFMVRRAVVRGKQPLETFKTTEGIIVGNAACSSIINSEDYRKLTKNNATILANSASLEIFNGSQLFGLYHSSFARFMATANARPFLQSANNWRAFALDHNGNMLASIEPVGAHTLQIQANAKKTPYTTLGEWLSILGGLFIAVNIIKSFLVSGKRIEVAPKDRK